MVVDPMLATSGPLPADEERWAFEPKWDGFRADRAVSAATQSAMLTAARLR
jgi:ATP-dependent DNA ligase